MPSTDAATAPASSTWGALPASDVSRRTFNPIRDVLSRPMLPQSTPKSSKDPISLSIGDPTVFGNFKTHDAVVKAVETAVRSFSYNGYPPSTI
ncbi:hypothetical protein EV177_009421 [Coemansia sp. RSA 1804]|nr:hypothetical protein EV177_009421 [Coemansia sp. RSA 1804]